MTNNPRAPRPIPIVPFNPAWLANIPELATRGILVAALSTMPDVRKKLFQCANDLESIALIPSRKVAERCLALWWEDERHILHRYWHDKLRTRTRSDHLFNELYGCVRNVYLNMLVKCGSRSRAPHYRRATNIERRYD